MLKADLQEYFAQQLEYTPKKRQTHQIKTMLVPSDVSEDNEITFVETCEQAGFPITTKVFLHGKLFQTWHGSMITLKDVKQ